jgi:DNA-binding PadR family transcriptional regulator
MTQDRHRPERFLPLPPAWLDILLALCVEDLHGYAVMQAVARVADAPLHPGTLYRALARLLESELIVELDERPREGDDERRRYYRVTDLGRAVARAEATRLERVVARARAARLFA